MLAGREYRKAISQNLSYAAFRWVAVWVLVASCASYGATGVPAALVIAAADILVTLNAKATFFAIEEKARRDWMERLTNRLFYKLFFEDLRAGRGATTDIDELFNLATKEAAADIKLADERGPFMDQTSWHWFGGFVSFLSNCAGSFFYYGSAVIVGSGGLR